MKSRILSKTVGIATAIVLAALLAAACEDREPQDIAFEMDLAGGELTGESLLTVNQNDNITIDWTSDVPVLVHLHGYDIELAVQPGVTEPMAFTADATGRFNITIHSAEGVHVHASGEACRVSVPAGEPQPGIEITAAESRTEGNVFIEVDVENFEIEPEGGHWHLTIDGVDYGMYSRSSVTLAVDGMGDKVFAATLADQNHCLYDAEDSTTVGIADGMNMDDTPMAGDHDMASMSGENTSAAGIPESVIATLEVRP